MRISIVSLVAGCDALFGLRAIEEPTIEEAVCTVDSECVDGVVVGRCDCGFCAYPDPVCPTTNRRWDNAAPGALAAACVAAPEQIDARVFHTCALVTDGHPWCWGWNVDAQLGAGQPLAVSSNVPIRVVASDGSVVAGLSEIGTGAFSTCGVREGRVVCWGGNPTGALGGGLPMGEGMRSADPVEVSLGTSSLVGVTSLSVGFQHACATVGNDQLYCWGDNFRGQIGDGTTTNRNIAVKVVGLPAGTIEHMGAGGEHTCAVIRETITTQTTWCWGRPFDGRLGNGTAADGVQPVPQRVQVSGGGFLQDVQRLAIGAKHTCVARHTPGVGPELYCWGLNAQGALGDDTQMWRVTATKVLVPAGDTFHLASDDLHTCGDINSDLWCWGSDESGQIGDGLDDSAPELRPIRVVPSAALRGLTAGFRYTCSLGIDRRVACWGANEYGQLGVGSTENKHEPTELPSAAFCPAP